MGTTTDTYYLLNYILQDFSAGKAHILINDENNSDLFQAVKSYLEDEENMERLSDILYSVLPNEAEIMVGYIKDGTIKDGRSVDEAIVINVQDLNKTTPLRDLLEKKQPPKLTAIDFYQGLWDINPIKLRDVVNERLGKDFNFHEKDYSVTYEVTPKQPKEHECDEHCAHHEDMGEYDAEVEAMKQQARDIALNSLGQSFKVLFPFVAGDELIYADTHIIITEVIRRNDEEMREQTFVTFTDEMSTGDFEITDCQLAALCMQVENENKGDE